MASTMGRAVAPIRRAPPHHHTHPQVVVWQHSPSPGADNRQHSPAPPGLRTDGANPSSGACSTTQLLGLVIDSTASTAAHTHVARTQQTADMGLDFIEIEPTRAYIDTHKHIQRERGGGECKHPLPSEWKCLTEYTAMCW